LQEGSECRQRQGARRSSLMAEWAQPFVPGHRPWQEPRGSWQCGGACARQEACARPQQVEEAVGIFGVSFTRAVLPRLTMGPDGVAGPQAALRAPALEPCVEGLPGETGWFHGARLCGPVCAQVCLEGLCKASDALPGVGKGELTPASRGLRPQTSTVWGFADINASEAEVRLVDGLGTLMGVASILLESHGTLLLVG
jgi:hypothetical protein